MVSVGMEVLAENLIGEDTVRHLLESFYGNFCFVSYYSSDSLKNLLSGIQLRYDYDEKLTCSFCSRRIASNGSRRARYVVVGS